MSIDVSIKQKGFSKKPLPLDVILGDKLTYGEFTNDRLIKGALGEFEFIAYDPKHIGRGFSVIWTENEKKRVDLRLPQPSTPEEICEFYGAIKRIVSYWKASLTVDGKRISPNEFMSGYSDMLGFNERTVKHFSQSVLDGDDDDYITVYSAMWPLHISKTEASVFINDAGAYYSWLHEKQAIDAEYASPEFFQGEGGITGRFFIRSKQAYLFPKEPNVPFGLTDPSTGKPLKCDDFRVCVMHCEEEDEPLGEVSFKDFMLSIPSDRISEYDAGLLLLEPFSQSELEGLLD